MATGLLAALVDHPEHKAQLRRWGATSEGLF